MVMYEDYCKGELFLRYENTPSANEVIRDVLNAPIESGETFQNKKKGMKAINDKFIVIDAPSLGKKAQEEIVATVTEKTGWKTAQITSLAEVRLEDDGKTVRNELFGFALPADAESEQATLMGV